MKDKYMIRFMPEYYGTSLRSYNQKARDCYDFMIDYEKLPLSAQLILKLKEFDGQVMNLINWDEPNEDSPMTYEERNQLYQKGLLLLEEVKQELGEDFEVINGLDWMKEGK